MPTIPESLTSALADRYALEREIGHGGMATVYLATDLKHNRRVAVKVLRPELAASLGAERFLKEIDIAAGLTHPHILTLIDSGKADNTLYYVMPFVDGESVRGLLIREERLSVDDALAITRKVAHALNYAHSMDVVHRDIKPENILLSQGHAVVADFGIARAITTAGVANLTRTGFPIGTPGYMSPEQAAGRADLDATTDVFSLACVVYEMLVGDTPGLWVSGESLRMERLLDARPAHREYLDRLPGRVEQSLVRAMAMRPEDRFQTPMDFVADLEASVSGARRRYDEGDVQEIMHRAASSQVSRPTQDAALTIGSVEQIAAEVGITPARVREAVGAMESSRVEDPPVWSTRLLGAPTTITLERVVEGEVPESEYPVMVEEIRTTLKNVGHVSTLARSLKWTTAAGALEQGRDVHVTITPRLGQTRIRVEEKMEPLAGGVFGGIVGGGGGGGGSAAAAITGTLMGPGVAVVAVIGVVGGFYALARRIYTHVADRRTRQLTDLIDRLADYARSTSANRVPGRESAPRLAP